MTGTLNDLFGLLIFVTVALTALSIGLVTSRELLGSALRHRRVVVVVGLNCVFVPLAAYLLVTALPLTRGSGTGVLVCAICAGGPLALKATQIARGDISWSLSLTVMLLVLNVLTLPLWTWLLVDKSMTLHFGDLVRVLGVAIVIPVAAGMAIRSRVADVDRWFKLLTLLSNVGLGLAVAVGLAANAGDLVRSFSLWQFLAVLAVIAVSAAGAWLVRDDLGRRQASTFSTLNRATSVALLIVGRAFSDQPEVFTAAVLFALTQTVIALGLALYWGVVTSRSTASAPATG